MVTAGVAGSAEDWLPSDGMVLVPPEVLLVGVVSVVVPATAVMMPAGVAGSVESWLPSDVMVVMAPVPAAVAVVPEVLVVVVVGGRAVVATAIHVLKDHRNVIKSKP